MATSGLNLRARALPHYESKFSVGHTIMTRLAKDPVTWMPMMGIATFVAVHGTLLAIVLRIG